MKKVTAAIILLVCLAGIDMLVGRSVLSGEQVSAGEFEQEMLVGLLIPLSGDEAERGRSAKRGFELAAIGLRAWGTSTVLEDSRCDVHYAKGAIERLLEDDVEVVIGAICPSVAEFVAGRLTEEGIVLVSLAAGPPDSAWRIDAYVANEEAQADYFVDWHAERYGSASDYTASLAFDVLTAVTMELRDNQNGAEEMLDHLGVMEHHGVSGVVKFRTVQ